MLARVPELAYKPHERDMCAMQHEVLVEYGAAAAAAAGLGTGEAGVMQTMSSQLLLYGDSDADGDTGMAKTVGLTGACTINRPLITMHD